MEKYKLFLVLMKNKFLSTLLILLIGLGYSVESSAQDFYLKTHNDEYISCDVDGVLAKGKDASNKQVWTVSAEGELTYISTKVGGKTMYLKLDASQIEGTSKITSKFIAVEDKTNIYLFDGNKSGSAAGIVTSVADNGKCYLVSPEIKTSSTSTTGYYIFRHDYTSGSTTVPLDAKLMVRSSNSNDSYKLSVGTPFSSSTITISSNNSANLNTQVIFEKAETPSVKYGKVTLGEYNTSFGSASIAGVTLSEAFSSEAAVAGAATKELTLTATANDGYVFKGWQLNGTLIEGSATPSFAYTYSYSSESSNPEADVFTPVFKEYVVEQYYINYGDNYVVTNEGSLGKATSPQVWNIENNESFQIQTISGSKTYNLGVVSSKIGLTENDSYVVSLFEASSYNATTWTKASSIDVTKYYLIVLKSGTDNYILYRSSQGTKDLTSKVLNTNTTKPYISGSTITLSSSTSPTSANAYFQFVTPATPEPTPTTYYGKVEVIGVNSTVVVSTSSSAPSSTGYAAESSGTWSTETSGESKDYYFYSKPSDDSEFVCYATDAEGKNPIKSASQSGDPSSSNNYKCKYAVTPAASEDEGNPTTTTIYAVYKKKSQETKYYGTVTAAIASNSTDGGTVAATSSYSTPSADKYTAGTSSAVRNAASGSKMHLYLFAKAAEGYEFKGWSTNADGSGDLLTSTNNYYQVEFDATSTNEASPTDGGTYYAVFESTTPEPTPTTYYGKVEVIGVNSTVVVSTSNSAPSTGYAAESSATWNTAISGEVKAYYFYSKADGDSEFVCYATDSEGKNPIESTSQEAASSSNNNKYKYNVTPAASEDEGSPTTTTIYAIYKKSGSSEQPAGDGLYLKNMGNSKYLQMVKAATDTGSSSKNDGQLGFVESIDDKPTSWVFTQYSTSSLVKFADSDDSNIVYFGNRGGDQNFYYKLTGIAKYNNSDNPGAKAEKQSSAGVGSKYNCYLYKINEYSSSASSLTATLVTAAEADGYYFIASANVQSGTGLMLMGNSTSTNSSSGSQQIAIAGTQISTTPGSSPITVEVSNIKNYVYQFVSGGTTPQPKKTLYGTLSVSATNGTASIAETSGVASSNTSVTVNAEVAANAENASKVLYLHATANANYEFLGWAETDGGEVLEGSNVAEYAYTFTFNGASQDAATSKTLYAVFQEVQPTAYYGKVTAAIASNSTDGGTVIATNSSATPSADNYTAGTSSAVRNAASGSKMHLYLFAKAAEGYEFKGWSTNADGSGDLLTSTHDYYQVEFDATSTTEASPTDGGTYYAVFEKEFEPTLVGNFFIKNVATSKYLNGAANLLNDLEDKQAWNITQLNTDGLSRIATTVSETTYNVEPYYNSSSSKYYFRAQTNAGSTAEANNCYFYEIADDAQDPILATKVNAPTVGKKYFIVGYVNSKYTVISNTSYTSSQGNRDTRLDGVAVTLNGEGKISIGKTSAAGYIYLIESTAPAAATVKYGKVTLAASVSNGTYNITSGAASGELITSEACSGAATQDIVLSATANDGYVFKGWSVDGGTTILEGSNVAPYTYTFSFSSEDESNPTEVTLTPVFIAKGSLAGDKYYITTANSKYLSTGTDATPVLTVGESQQVWGLDVQSGNLQIQTIHKDEAYNLNGTGTSVSFTESDNYNISLYAFDGNHSREITKVTDLSTINSDKTYAILFSTQEGSYMLNTEGTPSFVEIGSSDYPKWGDTHESIKLKDGSSSAVPTKYDIHFNKVQSPSAKYGKVTLAVSVSNGTYNITSGAASGELITSEACSGAATKDIVLSATANDGYVFKGWSVDGGATILEGSNVAPYTYTFSFSSEDESMPTEVTLTPVFEKLPELSGTTCFLMNGDNYIGYADGAFTSSTTDKQEWAFGTTSDFITPFSTLVNNQINYLGYPTSVGGGTTVFADVISPDNNSLYFFDTETNKPASSLKVGKSYYIVIKSTRSESTSRYVVSYEDGTLKTTKASETSGNYIISNPTISSDVTLTLDSSVKAACTFTLASTAPVAPTVKYGKVTLAVSVSNGTYNITSGAASGELITSEACSGAATQDIVLSATADDGYVFKGWSLDGGTTILEGSNVASYTYTFSFSSEDESMPTEVTLTPVFEEIPVLTGTDFYLKTHNNEYISCDSNGALSKGSSKQVWTVSEEGGLTYITTAVDGKTLYLKLDVNQIARNSDNKITSKFIVVEDKTNIFLFDGSKSDAAASIVTSVADGGKCYLVSPEVDATNNDFDGYYIFRHDYTSGSTTVPVDAKLMVTGNGSDSYKLSVGNPFSSSTITISSSNSANLNTQVIFEKAETPSVKTYFGTLTVVGTNGTVFASTVKEAASGETTVNVSKTVSAANATETIYLNASPSDKYVFLGWSETEGGEVLEGSNVEDFAYTFTFNGTEDEPTVTTLYAVFEYKYTTYYGTFNVSAGEGSTAFFAAEIGATEGSETEDVNEEVLKTVTSASKTFYLNATAPSDKYEFLGWSETEGGEILEGSNVEDFAYTFTFNGTEDEPTVTTLYAVFESMYTTYYGTFNVSAGEGGKAFFAAETGATEGSVTKAVNEEVLKTVTSASKTFYLNASPSDKYEFLGWSETEGGEVLADSNVEDFAYTFTFNGTGDEPTVTTLYAVFEYKYTTYCGTFNVSAGEGGTAFIAEASGATEGSLTKAVNEVVDKAETSASKTFYLNATAKSGYTFLGWSETENGEVLVGTNDKDFAYTFTFDGTEDNRTVKTLYAVFEDTKPGDIKPSTDITAYDNVLFFNDESTSIGRDFNLALNLKNADENITAFQCDVRLPRGIDWETTIDKTRGIEVLKAPAFNTERTDETCHDVTCSRIDGRTIRIIVKSMGKDVILGTEGAILTLPLSVADDMEGGDYNIFINDIVIATDQQEQTAIAQTVSKVSVADFNLGDVNSDGRVNVTDIVAIVAYMLNESPTPFVFKAADVHADNEINVTDIVGLIDIINAPASKSANAANGMRSGSYQDSDYALDIVANGQNVTLNMNNKDNITAFQCDVELSDGAEWISDNSGYVMPEFNKEAGRTDRNSHSISMKRLEDGKFRIIVYSLNNDEFLGTEGAVLNLPLAFTKDASCSISNIVLAKKNAESEYLNGSTYSFDATNINYIQNAQDANDVIFDINGVRSNKLMKGIYIINNAKVMVNE